MSPDEDDLPDIVDMVMRMGQTEEEPPASPSPPLAATARVIERLPGHLEDLAGRARDYVEAASSANTRRAYASDWRHFASWCRRQGIELLPPDPQVVGLYITACASGKATGDKKPNSVSTIERRLSSLTWNYAQRGQPLDRKDRHIATVMAGVRNKHASPPRQKEAVLPEDLIAMLETLPRGTLRGLRDRAMLLLGFAGGLRRSEIVGLDLGRDQTEDGRGWVEVLDKGVLVTLRGKTGSAEKAGAGGYRKTAVVATFASAFPMDHPRYVVIAMLDEPQGTAASSYQRTAAWNAVPIVGRVIPRIGPLLGVMPDDTRDIDISDLTPLVPGGATE